MSPLGSRSPQAFRSFFPMTPDPFNALLSNTMSGGTWLVSGLGSSQSLAPAEEPGYVRVRSEVIFEYERAILELRRELSHYRQLLSTVTGTESPEQQMALERTGHMSASAADALDSVLTARIPDAARFTDFEGGEL
jgi:hypothetical protein